MLISLISKLGKHALVLFTSCLLCRNDHQATEKKTFVSRKTFFAPLSPCLEITRYPQGRVCYLGSTQCEYLITFHTDLLKLSAAGGAARAKVGIGGQDFICISGRIQSQAHIRCVSRGVINKELLCSSKTNAYLHTLFPSTRGECEE